jgi:DNA-binding NarL/FixJ family response regulator
LLVDDDPSVIRALSRVLREYRPELQINTAPGAAQAIAALAEHAYDVVLTDLQMPGGGGRVVLDALVSRYPETVRVVHSSQPGFGDTLHRYRAHVFLAKPATESETLEVIDSAVRRIASGSVRVAS